MKWRSGLFEDIWFVSAWDTEILLSSLSNMLTIATFSILSKSVIFLKNAVHEVRYKKPIKIMSCLGFIGFVHRCNATYLLIIIVRMTGDGCENYERRYWITYLVDFLMTNCISMGFLIDEKS